MPLRIGKVRSKLRMVPAFQDREIGRDCASEKPDVLPIASRIPFQFRQREVVRSRHAARILHTSCAALIPLPPVTEAARSPQAESLRGNRRRRSGAANHAASRLRSRRCRPALPAREQPAHEQRIRPTRGSRPPDPRLPAATPLRGEASDRCCTLRRENASAPRRFFRVRREAGFRFDAIARSPCLYSLHGGPWHEGTHYRVDSLACCLPSPLRARTGLA